MAVQNNYNNYIKRQQQSPTNQFRQKVANSLSGKTVGNNTTTKKTTPTVMGQNTLGATVQPKPTQSNKINVTTPVTPQPQPTPQVNKTQSRAVATGEGMFIGDMPVNAPQSTTTPQNTTSEPVNTTQLTTTETQSTEGVGMMSLSEINNAIKGDTPQLTQEDATQVNELANNPQVQVMARSTNKAPQQLAQELVETQKQQLREEWEQQKAELELQKNQLQDSYNQSVKDADTSYRDTEKVLQENRYIQQQNLAVSGQNRGIQYSPQQLALENIANINLNKNLAEASNKRNELLNSLKIQLGQSLANVNMGLQNANVKYNTNVAQIMADYQKQMMDWAYNDQQTEADRNWQEQQSQKDKLWQEQQAQKDKDFEKEMAELQNKWQAEQNALDREQYGKSRSGGSGYSYGGYSYSPYSYSRSSYGGYSGYSDDLDLSTKEGETAFISTVKQDSTDLYNAFDYGTMNEVNEKGEIYAEEMNKYIDYAKSNGASRQVIDELEKTKKTALVHLYNKAYARSTGTDIKVGDTIYKGRDIGLPTSSEYRQKLKDNRFKDLGKYAEKTSLSDSDKSKNRFLVNTMKKVNTNSKKNTSKNTKAKQKEVVKNSKVSVSRDFAPNMSKKNTTSKTKTSTKNTKTKQEVKKNIKTNSKVTKNTKISTKDFAPNTTKKKVVAKKTTTKKTTTKKTNLLTKIKNLFKKK